MKTSNIKKEWIYWLTIIILILLLLRTCNKPNESTGLDVIITTKDSIVYVPGKSDTLYFEKIATKHRLKPTNVDSVKEFDNLPVTAYMYQTLINDSLIDGQILSRIEGSKLIYTDLSYTPKFPKYITRVDTLKEFKTTTVEKTKNKWELYVGSNIGGSTENFVLAPGVLVRTNKNFSITLGYDLINKTYNIGYYQKLNGFNSRRNK